MPFSTTTAGYLSSAAAIGLAATPASLEAHKRARLLEQFVYSSATLTNGQYGLANTPNAQLFQAAQNAYGNTCGTTTGNVGISSARLGCVDAGIITQKLLLDAGQMSVSALTPDATSVPPSLGSAFQ